VRVYDTHVLKYGVSEIDNVFGINKNNSILFCYASPLFAFNFHIPYILINILYIFIKNNKKSYKGIKIFKDLEKIKKHLSIFGFYAIYPSFNLSMSIEDLNKIIEDFINETNINIPIKKYDKLPTVSLNEFGTSSLLYNNFIDND
jgi:hypothetical protein